MRLVQLYTLTPPSNLFFIGALGKKDFVEVGQEFRRYFIEMAFLKPYERVLDVGCGIGRMAIPLTQYLSRKGEYWGFDIVKEGIDWCQKNISFRFRNFHFLYADVYNKHYNPQGRYPASRFLFPFDDRSIDFVFLTSVFTHMYGEDLNHYAHEIGRVLRNGARCLTTFFLLNSDSQNMIETDSSTLKFKFDIDGSKTIDEAVPEKAVAHHEDTIRDLLCACGLKIVEPIHYGSWCGRSEFKSAQDIVVAEKIES